MPHNSRIRKVIFRPLSKTDREILRQVAESQSKSRERAIDDARDRMKIAHESLNPNKKSQ